jgi:RND family efflux transporter MFP subunit
MAPVHLDARARSLAGIQTAPAQHEPLAQALRAAGTVVPDERQVRVVHTKVSGWIDKLYVNFTGQEVRRGQPVLGIYSPELLATQEEFLRALEAARRLAGASPEAAESGAKLLQAARRRLELFDVPASFVDALERSGEAQRSVTLLAPSSGHVTSKGVFEGQTVEPGMELFTVTDLSRVWIVANVYEYEAPLVHEGQHATLSLPFDPSVRLDGRVAYVDPYLDAETRTLEVRFEFPNRDLVLKPAMYVDVSLHGDDRMGIVIPESALLDSGLRKVVFVETSPGRFEPREVRTGVRGDGKVQVVSGVQAGERVVVRANFLLDSESRLRSALGATDGSAGPDR